MTSVATPLQHGDPPRLGPFAIQARLSAGPSGLVYLGQAPDGRVVTVAVLTRGAARDPAARDRFLTAIREMQSERGVRAFLARATRGRTAVLDGRPPVVAMEDGPAPWVATAYLPGRAGAERYLDSVIVTGTLIGERHGPDFAPYWLADRAPALPAPPRPAPPPTETRRSVVLASAVLALLVLLLSAMAWLLLRGDDDPEPAPQPLPPTQFEPTPPPQPASPVPELPSPSPSPGESGSGSPRPDDGDEGEGNPI
jgi:hypothetical protein